MTDARELVERARAQRAKDHVARAVDAYRQALRIDPDDRDVLFELATFLVEADRREQARELLDHALAHWPGDARGWRIRGRSWLIDGDAARAIPDLAEACRLGDDGAPPLLARARGGEPLVLPGVMPILAWSVPLDVAHPAAPRGPYLVVADLPRSVVLDGDLSPAYADKRRIDDDAMCRSKDLARSGEIAAALALLAEAGARCPEDPRLEIRRGLLSFAIGDDAGAIAGLGRRWRSAPERLGDILALACAAAGDADAGIGSLAIRGLGHLRAGRLDHAERDLDLALRKSAGPTPLLLRGHVLFLRGRLEEAAADYVAALKKARSAKGDPRLALVLRGGAQLGLARLGRAPAAEARRSFEQLGWAPGVVEADRLTR